MGRGSILALFYQVIYDITAPNKKAAYIAAFLLFTTYLITR